MPRPPEPRERIHGDHAGAGVQAMAAKSSSIYWTPLLRLRAVATTERFGFDEDETLSQSNALAELDARTKGRGPGMLKTHEEGREGTGEARRGALGRAVRPRRVRCQHRSRCAGRCSALKPSGRRQLGTIWKAISATHGS